MSKKNGDKARFDKARMKKLRRRESTHALRKAMESNPAPKSGGEKPVSA